LAQKGHFDSIVQCEDWRPQDQCLPANVFFGKIIVLPSEWPRLAAGRTICSDTSQEGYRGEGVRFLIILELHFHLPAGGAMALELAVISAVVGAVLGLRYKVLILVPAIMFALMFAALVGIARTDSALSVVLLMATAGAAVQIGYLAGIVIRAVIEWACALLVRNRNLGLSSLGPLWPQAWQLNTWGAPGAMARLRQPRSPQG
jgi:hypothetical protein